MISNGSCVGEFNGIGHLSMIDGKSYKNYKEIYSQFLESDKEILFKFYDEVSDYPNLIIDLILRGYTM